VIKIYGASDDLIEIKSDNTKEFPSEEFYVANGVGMLAFSDGTLLHVYFGRWGIWRITLLDRGLNFSHIEFNDDQDDVAFINAHDLKWIVLSQGEIRP
jgi:hypothetical protein